MDIRQSFFPKKVIEMWNRLPMAEPSPLEGDVEKRRGGKKTNHQKAQYPNQKKKKGKTNNQNCLNTTKQTFKPKQRNSNKKPHTTTTKT